MHLDLRPRSAGAGGVEVQGVVLAGGDQQPVPGRPEEGVGQHLGVLKRGNVRTFVAGMRAGTQTCEESGPSWYTVPATRSPPAPAYSSSARLRPSTSRERPPLCLRSALGGPDTARLCLLGTEVTAASPWSTWISST